MSVQQRGGNALPATLAERELFVHIPSVGDPKLYIGPADGGAPVAVAGGGSAGTVITVNYDAGSPDWSTVTGADFIADDGTLSGVRLATDRVFPENYIQAGATACIADGSGGGIVVQDLAIWSAKAIPGGIRINVDTQGAGGDGLLIINLP